MSENVTTAGRRARAPKQDNREPPTPEQALLAAERATRWGKAVMTLTAMMGAFLTFLSVTGATVLDVPMRQDRLEARADTLAASIRSLREDFGAHVLRDRQEDRAQTCALRQMARGADPAGCFEFLPEPAYYDPPQPHP
jgi:hypothetical protein